MRALFFILIAICCLAACSSETHYAPVMDIATIEHVPKTGMYRVSPGETLYSIAWRYGLDYRYVAALNHIAPPFHVVAGQKLYLKKAAPIRQPKQSIYQPVKTIKTSQYVFSEPEVYTSVRTWRWPARGPVVGTYSSLNKGINISGQLGDPVYATAGGQIVYCGNGLRGYGNLIIIKHNSTYLTAYAHNHRVLVREGQRVQAGQKIAEMGRTGARRVMLHFEIRRNGQPVNPLYYLSKKPIDA